MEKKESIVNSDAEGFFKVYAAAAANLRTWLIAYGIGAPVLFLTHDSLCKALQAAGCLKQVGTIFMIGVGFQVFIAALNKNIMWACYWGATNSEFQNKTLYRVSSWLSNQYWLDVICDLLSILFFVTATARAAKCF